MEKVYSTEKVAEMLHVSIITIRRYIKSGKLPASKIGKSYCILESDIDGLLKKSKVKV